MATASKQDLEGLKKRLTQRAERLRGELQQVDDDLRCASRTIELLRHGGLEGSQDEAWPEAYLREFEGMTQIQALVKMAQDSGNNTVKVSEARKLFMVAGLSKSKKNVTNILHSTLDSSEKFRKVAPGEYELFPLKLVVGRSLTNA